MKPLIVANWKMNPKTQKEAQELFNFVKKGAKNLKNVELVICPPFIWLMSLIGSSASARQKTSYGGSAVAFGVGGQNCFWQDSGPFTGETSPKMLKDIGCKYVIIGHSERRINLGETDEMINKKLKDALKAGLFPILCIGETGKQRKLGQTKQVLSSQLKNAFKGNLQSKSDFKLSIAYEPVWSISTMSKGDVCRAEDARKALIFIKGLLNKILGQKVSQNIRILYGGSVDSKNAKEYIQKGEFEGLLVGGASLNSKEFVKILKNIDKE